MFLLVFVLRTGHRIDWCSTPTQVKGYRDPSKGGDLILGDCEHLLSPACHRPDVTIVKHVQLICVVIETDTSVLQAHSAIGRC
jgi:hypothetical protein